MKQAITYTDYYRPTLLLKTTNYLIDNLIYLGIFFCSLTIYLGFISIGEDYQQGEYYRIIYVHVACAWNSFLIYYVCAFFSFLYIVTRNNIFASLASRNMEIGLLFSLVTLITGSIWGKPTWGTWWVWDARLTSVFLLFLIYLCYIIISSVLEHNKHNFSLSVYCLIGTFIIPIIKKSVEWWNTLHQVSSITQSESHVHLYILVPLLSMWITTLIIVTLYNIYNIRYNIINNKISKYTFGEI